VNGNLIRLKIIPKINQWTTDTYLQLLTIHWSESFFDARISLLKFAE